MKIEFNDIDNKIIGFLKHIPAQYLCKRDNCNDLSVLYIDQDIEQLAPSTHPVFRISNINTIVKIFHSKNKALNEIKARRVLSQSFSVLPARVVRWRNLYLLVMPDLPNSSMLSSVSRNNFGLFALTLNDIIASFHNYLERSISSDPTLLRKVRYPGRTKRCFIKWLWDLNNTIGGVVLVSEKTRKKYILHKEFRDMHYQMKKPSSFCCLFSGDMNMQNIICQSEQYYLIDLEYWGYYDAEFIISKIISSIFFHCNVFLYERITYINGVYRVNYDLQMSEYIYMLLRKLLKGMIDMGIDTQRIKAFIVSRIYYRFKTETLLEDNSCIVKIACIFDFFNEIYKN